MSTPRARKRRSGRSRKSTVAVKALTKRKLRAGWIEIGGELGQDEMPPRPRTRADCQFGPRPCPWVACKHHLYLDVDPETGSIILNFPDLEPWELEHTCALDVVERGALTLDEVGDIMNLTRERIRQIEVRAIVRKLLPSMRKLKMDD